MNGQLLNARNEAEVEEMTDNEKDSCKKIIKMKPAVKHGRPSLHASSSWYIFSKSLSIFLST